MYTLQPVSERVSKIRQKYRTTKPKVDISRYRLVTEFYMDNPQITGILKRAKVLRLLFEQMPVTINEDEVIVGWQGATYRSSALYPENQFDWMLEELRNGTLPTRETDPYDIDPEDAQYIYDRTDSVGFLGASSAERIPIEGPLTEAVRQFKSATIRRR